MEKKPRTRKKTTQPQAEAPPQRRREPKQARSQLLVESIKQACITILNEQGEQALSVNNLVEKAGIEIGSLYQYYPNLDAVVGEICRDEVIRYLEGEIAAMSQMEGIPPEEYLRYLVQTVVNFHRRLLAFDRTFFTQYKPYFRLTNHYNQLMQDAEATSKNYQRFLATGLPQHHEEMAIFVMDNCIDHLIEKAVVEHPEYLEDPAFADFIYRMCSSLLDT